MQPDAPIYGPFGNQRCAVDGCDEIGDVLLLSPTRSVRVRVCTKHSDSLDSHGFHMVDPRQNLLGGVGVPADPRMVSDQ